MPLPLFHISRIVICLPVSRHADDYATPLYVIRTWRSALDARFMRYYAIRVMLVILRRAFSP